MRKTRKYAGIDNDEHGGMTSIGKVILDAWVFDLLPETETCQDWEISRIEALMQQVNAEWDKYGCMVSQLPTALRERHQRIYSKAIQQAKSAGWTGETETGDE